MSSSMKEYNKEKLAKRPHRTTSRKLAKAMPEVVEGLQSEKREEHDAAIVEVCKGLIPDSFNGKTLLTKDGVAMDKYELSLMVLAGLAVGNATQEERKLKELLKTLISFKMTKCVTVIGRENFSAHVEIVAWKSSFDSAVDELKQEIIKTCYQRSEDEFNSKCKAYNATVDDFRELLGVALLEVVDLEATGIGKMAIACTGVQLGCHKSKWICWNCGKEGKVCCSQCRAAKYCSKDCQQYHWKVAHRPACKDTKAIFSLYELDKATVDGAHQDPDAHAKKVGVGPAAIDFQMLGFVVMNLMLKCGATIIEHIPMAMIEPWLDECPGQRGCNRPCMTNFYNNVKRVVENGFLLSPGAPPVGFPEKRERDDTTFLAICQAMMFDYSSLPVDQQMHMFRKTANSASGGECKIMTASVVEGGRVNVDGNVLWFELMD